MNFLKCVITTLLITSFFPLFTAEKKEKGPKAKKEKVTYRETPEELENAIQHNDVKAVIDHLNKNPEDIDTRSKCCQRTVLMEAISPHEEYEEKAQADRTPLIRELLSRTKDINATTDWGWTALHFLVTDMPNIALIQEFIKRGANIHAKDKQGQTLLMAASRKQVPQYEDYILHPASSGETKIYVPKKSMANKSYDKQVYEDYTLHPASSGETKIYVPKKFTANKSYNKQLNVIQFLLNIGADINAVDNDGANAFLHSIESANLPVIELLLNNPKAKFDIHFKDNNGENALFKAVWALNTLKYMKDQFSPEEISRYQKNLEAIINMLIKQGIPIDEQNKYQNTAFINAATNCIYPAIKFLSQFNPKTAAHWDPKVNQSLLFAEDALKRQKTKADIEECQKVIAFLKTMEPGYKETPEYKEKEFAQKAEKEITGLPQELTSIVGGILAGHEEPSKIEMTKIKKAIAEDNQKELTKLFYENVYNLTLKDDFNDTPLMIAIKLNNINAVKLILAKLRSLDRKEEMNVTRAEKKLLQAQKEETAENLRYKVEGLKESMAHWLKTQLNARNYNGQDVYAIADAIGNKEIIKLLPAKE